MRFCVALQPALVLLLLATGSAQERFTYASLAELMQELRHNDIRREEIVIETAEHATKRPIITIKNVRVESVKRQPGWEGVVVTTYEEARAGVLFALVYIDSEMMRMWPKENFTGLRRDDRVTVVGTAYKHRTLDQKGVHSEAISISGVVVPAAKKPPAQPK